MNKGDGLEDGLQAEKRVTFEQYLGAKHFLDFNLDTKEPFANQFYTIDDLEQLNSNWKIIPMSDNDKDD